MNIKFIVLLIFCVAMFFPIIGNWMKIEYDRSLVNYYSLWGIQWHDGYDGYDSYSDYDEFYSPTKALKIIITCVILGYVLLISSFIVLILLPTSNVFIVPLITSGILSVVSCLLWIKTNLLPFKQYTPCLYLELIGGILMIIFGASCQIFRI